MRMGIVKAEAGKRARIAKGESVATAQWRTGPKLFLDAGDDFAAVDEKIKTLFPNKKRGGTEKTTDESELDGLLAAVQYALDLWARAQIESLGNRTLKAERDRIIAAMLADDDARDTVIKALSSASKAETDTVLRAYGVKHDMIDPVAKDLKS